MFGGCGTPGAGSLGTATGLSHEMTWTILGKPFGIIGLTGCMRRGGWKGDTYDAGIFCLFLFQMVFMDTTATIPTGAAAERWKFSAFMLYGAFIGTVMYPVFGNWVWGGGWLSQLGVNFGLGHGHVDFAGSSVVHLQGGVIALIFAWLIGPRIGKYNKDGTMNPFPAHNIPMAILGTFILAFGWFGFNPGSTLSGTDLRIAVVATNTMLASATGCLGAIACGCGGAKASRIPACAATACWRGWSRSPVLALLWIRSARARWGWFRACSLLSRCSSSTKLALTTRWAPSRSTASTAPGAVCRWGCSETARMAKGVEWCALVQDDQRKLT